MHPLHRVLDMQLVGEWLIKAINVIFFFLDDI